MWSKFWESGGQSRFNMDNAYAAILVGLSTFRGLNGRLQKYGESERRPDLARNFPPLWWSWLENVELRCAKFHLKTGTVGWMTCKLIRVRCLVVGLICSLNLIMRYEHVTDLWAVGSDNEQKLRSSDSRR